MFVFFNLCLAYLLNEQKFVLLQKFYIYLHDTILQANISKTI